MENVINNKDSSSVNVDTLRHAKSDAQIDESTKCHPKKREPNKEKSLTGLHFLKQSFRTLSVPKKSTEKIVEKGKNNSICNNCYGNHHFRGRSHVDFLLGSRESVFHGIFGSEKGKGTEEASIFDYCHRNAS